LPAPYTFVAADSGTHDFAITLATAGSQSVTVRDSRRPKINGTGRILVIALGDIDTRFASTFFPFTLARTRSSETFLSAVGLSSPREHVNLLDWIFQEFGNSAGVRSGPLLADRLQPRLPGEEEPALELTPLFPEGLAHGAASGLRAEWH
jgi:hypothetical protein